MGLINCVTVYLLSILSSFIGSVLVVWTMYKIYARSSRKLSEEKPYAECWWLPAWNCFRFVIRNMDSQEPVFSVKYRSWLRTVKPGGPGSSVNSFVDTELTSDERILLPPSQDLPVVCFRIEEKNGNLRFVHTDKLGTPCSTFQLTSEFEGLNVEYYLRVQLRVSRWLRRLIFKHEITRAFSIPFEKKSADKTVNIFREKLLPIQKGPEHKFKLIFLSAQVVTVSD